MLKLGFKSGITTFEIVFVIVLSGIFGVALLATLNNFIRSRQKTLELDRLQNTAAMVFNEIIQAAHWSDSVDIDEPPYEFVLNQEGDIITFALDSNRILKNSTALTGEDVKVVSFTVEDLVNNPTKVPCLKVQLALEYNSPEKGKITFSDNITVSLRKMAIGTPP